MGNTNKISEDDNKGTIFEKIGKTAENVANKSKELASKAQGVVVNTLDQNGDGHIGRDDFGLDDESIEEGKAKAIKIVSETGGKIKNTSEILGKAIADVKEEMDRKSLRPIFLEDVVRVCEDGSRCSKILETQQSMIRIVARDKKRDSNVVCNGAIGYRESIRGIDLLSIYEEYAKDLGVRFSPSIEQTFFYVDPFQKDLYISLDEYFSYFKKQRVNELEMVAQKLGAKRVKIAFRETAKTFVKKEASAKINGGNSIGASGGRTNMSDEETALEIAADIKFGGYAEPSRPELLYFKYESDIQRLIEMRLDQSANLIQSKTYKFQCSKTLGLKENVAGQIDGVLRQLKCSGNARMEEETRREGRTELEYYIEF